MAAPLELSYNWRTPAFFATVGAFICLSVLLRGRVSGWLAAAVLVVLLWVVFLGVLYLRTRAYLLVEGDQLTVRQYGRFHTITADQLAGVRQYLTPHGPFYRLTVRGQDGSTRRVNAPVALLKGGHPTLFAWILAEAPHAELDNSSQRTVERLQSKGLLP
jgi:Ca2+/Na+ antiporter